jgi:L-asparagine transporter-like permease
MKNANTFLTLMFITAILMLVSFATANIYLLLFSEIFFFISGAAFYIINKNLKKQTNAKRF